MLEILNLRHSVTEMTDYGWKLEFLAVKYFSCYKHTKCEFTR